MNNEKYDEINRKSKEVWERFIKLQPKTDLMFPDENLIRIFSNRYIEVPEPPAKVLDHGFGGGNNLLFYASKGYECYGCEISEELIRVTKEKFEEINIPINLKLIKGDFLEYDDNFFDIIISWNVIHYLGTKGKVIKMINEMHRTLRPKGVLILSTLHSEISLLKRSKHIGDGSYKVIEASQYDNRKDLTLFATKSSKELIDLFSFFSEVKYGYYNFDLFLPIKSMGAQLIYAIK